MDTDEKMIAEQMIESYFGTVENAIAYARGVVAGVAAANCGDRAATLAEARKRAETDHRLMVACAAAGIIIEESRQATKH